MARLVNKVTRVVVNVPDEFVARLDADWVAEGAEQVPESSKPEGSKPATPRKRTTKK